jgi:EPS-associated MarR family transcriptional regulator
MNEENTYKLFKALTESGDMACESGDMTSFRRNEDRVTRFDNDFNNATSFKSQRQLAEELGFSLGKLNYCLPALIDKGLVKAENFRQAKNKRRYIYQLTPAGLKEKAAVTLRFLKQKQKEYEKIKLELEQLKKEVKAEELQ